MTKLGSRNYIIIYPKVTKLGSIIGYRIDYIGVGALRGAPPHISRDSYTELGLKGIDKLVQQNFM